MGLRFCFVIAFAASVANVARAWGSSVPIGIDPTKIEVVSARQESTRAGFQLADLDTLGRMEATDWDSAFAAYDRNLASARRGRLDPLPRIEYNKAQGLHLEMGVGYGPFLGVAERIEARYGYDLARERSSGSFLLRVGRADPLLPPAQGELQLGTEAEWHEGASPFGDHDPYGNTLLTAVAGYDARQYLRERGGGLDFLARVGAGFTARVGMVRVEQRPLRALSDWHLFGDDFWMEENRAAKRLTASGLRASVRRAPEFATPEEIDGTYLRAAVLWLQSGGLDGADFARFDASLFQHGSFGWEDDWAIALRLASTTGDRPLQSMPTLGGNAGLRAYRPWSYIGSSLAYARAQYELSGRHLRRTRAPILARLGLLLIPFAEVGVVARDDKADYRGLGLGSEHARWDLGFGLRHSLVGTGQAAHAQVDFAWPVGEVRGPVRITLSISNDGLD